MLAENKKIVLSFAGATPDDCTRYARELKDFLLTAIDALQVHQHRERDDSQDFGTTLIIVLGTTAINTLAQGIAVWLQRNSGVRINVNKTNGELVAEGLDSKDVAEIVKALSSAS